MGLNSMRQQKSCGVCNKKFIPRSNGQKYCSEGCFKKQRKEKHTIYCREYRIKNHGAIRENEEKYRLSHHEEVKKRIRLCQRRKGEKEGYDNSWKKRDKEKYNTLMRGYARRPEEKIKNKARRARIGFIKEDSKCLLCRSKEDLQFHHIDYEDDMGCILCSKCHGKQHRMED